MTEKQRWQQPVFLDPEQLSAEPKQQTKQHTQAQDIPLDIVQPVEESEEEETPLPAEPIRTTPRRGRKWLKRFAISAGTLLTLTVGVELYRLIDWGFDTHALLGYGFTALTVGVLGSGALWLRHSLKGLQQLKQAAEFRDEAKSLLGERSQGQAAPYLGRLSKHYRHSPVEPSLQETISEIDSAYNDGEIITFVSSHGFSPQDEAAYRKVTRYSVESAALVGLSPFASFDMLLVGWRNLRLLNEIASIYGVAPGLPTQWRLLKQVLYNMAFAGLTELSFDTGEALLGSSLTSSISVRMGQGLGAGLLTARIGLQAMQACRPIPYNESQRPRLKNIQRRLVAELKKIGERER